MMLIAVVSPSCSLSSTSLVLCRLFFIVGFAWLIDGHLIWQALALAWDALPDVEEIGRAQPAFIVEEQRFVPAVDATIEAIKEGIYKFFDGLAFARAGLESLWRGALEVLKDFHVDGGANGLLIEGFAGVAELIQALIKGDH